MGKETMKEVISKSVENCDNVMSLDVFDEKTAPSSKPHLSVRTALNSVWSKLRTMLCAKHHSELRSEFKEVIVDIAKNTDNVISFKEMENL